MSNMWKGLCDQANSEKATYLITYCFLYFILFFILFYELRRTVDFAAHIKFAREFALYGKPHSERFGFELLVVLLAGFSKDLQALAQAAIIVLTIAVLVKALISIYIASKECKFSLAIFLSVIAIFVAPITLSWSKHPLFPYNSPVHLGQFSGFIIHNPTTVLVFPFSLMLFYSSIKERYLLTALLAAFSCVIKPNFVLAWMPCFVLFQIWKYGYRHEIAIKTAISLIPSLAILTTQLFTTKDLGDGILILPFAAWKQLSNNIPLSILRSIAFPGMFTILYFEEIRNHKDLWFAWLILFVATLQYSLFFITGKVYSGNWSWGRYLAVYNVFLLCLIRFSVICCKRSCLESISRVVKNGVLFILISLHFVSGICYYIRGVLFHEW